MLPAETLMVDGIVAPLTADGDKLGYFLFDLPYLDGHDLSRVPLKRRKALLEELVRRAGQGSHPLRRAHRRAAARIFTARRAGWASARWCRGRRGRAYDAKAGWVTVACKKGKKKAKAKTKASAPLPDPHPRPLRGARGPDGGARGPDSRCRRGFG